MSEMTVREGRRLVFWMLTSSCAYVDVVVFYLVHALYISKTFHPLAHFVHINRLIANVEQYEKPPTARRRLLRIQDEAYTLGGKILRSRPLNSDTSTAT
jgi:hypothetical protein